MCQIHDRERVKVGITLESTGHSNRVHLHFVPRKARCVDPYSFEFDRGLYSLSHLACTLKRRH